MQISRHEHNWVQRMPTVLFATLCVAAVLAGAAISFILGAIVGGIVGIDDKGVQGLIPLGFAIAGGVGAGVLMARARSQRSQEQRDHTVSSVQGDRAAPHGGNPIEQPHESVRIRRPAISAPIAGWTRVLRQPWIYMAFAALAALALLLMFDDSPSNLKVVSYPGRVNFPLTLSPRLTTPNVGNHPVKILGIEVNEREDCSTSDNLLSQEGSKFPVELKVGDTGTWFTPCGIVRTTVKTSDGTATYSF
jgi:hypothetical protein